MDDTAKIVAKIRKILAYADEDRNDNENERATALRQAHALLAKHGLEMADVQVGDDNPFGALGRVKIDISGVWKRQTVNAIGRLYGCYVFRTEGTSTISIVGRQAKVVVARAMATYVITSIDREARAAANRSAVHGKTFLNSFGRGAAAGVWRQVNAILAAQAAGKIDGEQLTASRALVVVNQHALALTEAQAAARRLTGCEFRNDRSAKASVDADAYYAGARYGSKLSLNTQLGSGVQRRIAGA